MGRGREGKGREGKGREGRGKGRGKGRGGLACEQGLLLPGLGGGWVGLGGVGQAFLNVRALKKIQESFENSL